MKYSTTVAIFLGLVEAQTVWEDLTNGMCTIDTVTDETLESTLTTCSSMADCNADADCSDEDERCGYYAWTESDLTRIEDGICVYKYNCGDVGLSQAGQTFQLLCYDDTEPDTLPDTNVIFANVEDLVNVAETKDWTTGDIEQMKIPSRDNYQTGHWIADVNGLWGETDKAVNNLCTANTDCATGECCANWPDSNNLRCISSDLAGVEQDLEPFTSFTPACAVNSNQAPTSAKDDLASEAQAKAAEELDTFAEQVRDEEREADGYDDMTVAEEEAWDEAWAEDQLEVEAADQADREAAGYDDMDNTQKAVFDSELLKWKEDVYEDCKEDENSIACTKAAKIREDLQAKRVLEGYYTEMNAEEREEFEEEEHDAEKKLVGELTAAWYTANTPAAGEPGSTCSESVACTGENHCCGTSTPVGEDADDAVEGKCADQTTLKWTDGLGVAYTHVCGAQKLMVALTALIATASLM